MGIYRGNVFKINFNDLEQVKKLADILGPGNVVVKYPSRKNYNITHDGKRLEYLKLVYKVEEIYHGKTSK